MKKRNFRVTALIQDLDWIIESIRKSRARTFGKCGLIVPDDKVPASMERWAIGRTFGQFHEKIIRREVRTDGVPSWFDAKENPAHVGFIDRAGLRAYVELEIDEEQRSRPSTFDVEIRNLAVVQPSQTDLFG